MKKIILLISLLISTPAFAGKICGIKTRAGDLSLFQLYRIENNSAEIVDQAVAYSYTCEKLVLELVQKGEDGQCTVDWKSTLATMLRVNAFISNGLFVKKNQLGGCIEMIKSWMLVDRLPAPANERPTTQEPADLSAK